MGLGAALALQALGRGLSNDVGGAIYRAAAGQREASALAHERDRQQRTDELQAAQLALQGVHRGTAPTVEVAAAPPPIFQGASGMGGGPSPLSMGGAIRDHATGVFGGASASTIAAPTTTTLAPSVRQLTPDFYVNESETPEARTLATKQANTDSALAGLNLPPEEQGKVRALAKLDPSGLGSYLAARDKPATPRPPDTQIVQDRSGNFVVVDKSKAGPTGILGKTPPEPNQMSGLRGLAALTVSPYYRDTTVSQSMKIAGAYNRLVAAGKAAQQGSPSSQLALVYDYFRLTNPDVAVRDNEPLTLEQTRSLPQNVQGYFLRASKGQKLTPEQIGDLLGTAQHFAAQQRQQFRATYQHYKDVAEGFGHGDLIPPDPFDTVMGQWSEGNPGSADANTDARIARLRAQGKIK